MFFLIEPGRGAGFGGAPRGFDSLGGLGFPRHTLGVAPLGAGLDGLLFELPRRAAIRSSTVWLRFRAADLKRRLVAVGIHTGGEVNG